MDRLYTKCNKQTQKIINKIDLNMTLGRAVHMKIEGLIWPVQDQFIDTIAKIQTECYQTIIYERN